VAENERQSPEELERLRSENAELRARNAKLAQEPAGRRPGRWRWPVAIVLLVLGGVLLAAAVPALWAANTLLNTDRYTETVAPLAQDPSIRDSVAVTAVDRLFARANVQTQVRDALPPKAAFIAPQITDGLHSFSITTAEAALATPRFQTLWTEVNRQAHQRIVPALLSGTGQGGTGALSIEQGTVSVDITKIVAQVKQALVSRGLTIVQSIPDTVAGGTVVLFQSAQLGQLQTILRGLQTASIVLPILALLAFIGAVASAPDRRKALLWLGITAIVAMIALGVGLALIRNAYVASPPAGILDAAAATAFFDTIVRFLRDSIRAVAALGFVLLVGAAIAGPSSAAVRLRSAVSGGFSALGLDFGEPAVWVDRHRRGLDITIVVIAAAVLLFSNTPTAGLVLGVAVAVLIGFLLVELVAHAHGGPPTFRGQPSM
jgi:hypothetical protein